MPTPAPAPPAPDSKTIRTVAQGEVLRQLERILAHPLFQKSQRLSAFLRFAVETTLAGKGDSLKEFVIGAEVFERGNLFDPQSVCINTDHIVRLRIEYGNSLQVSSEVTYSIRRRTMWSVLMQTDCAADLPSIIIAAANRTPW